MSGLVCLSSVSTENKSYIKANTPPVNLRPAPALQQAFQRETSPRVHVPALGVGERRTRKIENAHAGAIIMKLVTA